MSSIFDLVSPGLFFALDFSWFNHALLGLFSSLLLPFFIVAILAGMAGTELKSLVEPLFEAMSMIVIVLIDVSVAMIKFSLMLIGFLAAAIFRTIAEHHAQSKASVNVKTGSGPEYGERANKNKSS